MFKLLYVLGGAIAGALLVENNHTAKVAFNTVNLKVSKLFESAKTRISGMEL